MDFDTKVQPVQKFTANYGKRWNSRQVPKFTASVNSWFSSSPSNGAAAKNSFCLLRNGAATASGCPCGGNGMVRNVLF